MKKNNCSVFRFILLVSLFFVFFPNAEAEKEKQLLLVVPVVINNILSPDFFSVIHSAVPYFYKAKNTLKIEILADDILSEQYAKITLHSYGLNNKQISILRSIHSFPLGDVFSLDVCGTLSLKDRDYLRQNHVELQAVQVLNNGKLFTDIRWNTKHANTAIIVLGTSSFDETTPSLDMVRRVETGIKILKRNPDAVLIFSGGKTAGPISEARMMALIAYARGILPSQVILEEDSLSTIENAQFVDRIVKKVPIKRFILVSRLTHLKRAVPIFSKYSEFKDMQAIVSPISKQEISNNFEEYLAFKDSERVRQILRKILKEFRDAGL